MAMILKNHGMPYRYIVWYAIQILAYELGNTTQMRVWALIKLRVKLGSWTLIMKKETSLQTLKGYEERNTFYVKVWLASLTQFKRWRKAFWRQCCWAEIFRLNGGSKQAKAKKTGIMAVPWELRRNWGRPWKLQRGVGGLWFLVGRTWFSDWTKTIINPSEGFTTGFPEAWVLYLQVWQEQDTVMYQNRASSSSAHHPLLGIFDSQVQDTLWFRTEKRADRRSCRLRKMGKTERERDGLRKRQTDTVLTTQTWNSERRKEDVHLEMTVSLGFVVSEILKYRRIGESIIGLKNCRSVCLECPIIFWWETSEKTGIFKKITNWCLDCASSNKPL